METQKYRTLSKFWYWLIMVFTCFGLFFALNQIFLIKPQLENKYLYSLIASFLSLIFVIFPAAKNSPKSKVPWYDVILFILTIGIATYFYLKSGTLTHTSYMFQENMSLTIPAFIFCLLVLEAIRRSGGLILFSFAAIFACYPMVANIFPGILKSAYFSPGVTIRYHALGLSSILGLPLQVVGSIIIGFIVFGVVMMDTGGGKFFLDLSFALFGTHRGGPAKVAIVSSALFGSLSGSVVSNIITTGSMTIPTMKRAGYSPTYAAAIETCASTGGCIMPPVMGTVAFIMASFLGVPYVEVLIAAIIPAFLYYIGLFFQVDAYAARNNLKGLQKSQIPNVCLVIKKGWLYIFAFAILMYFIILGKVGQAPFISILFLLAMAMMRKETRLNLQKFLQIIKKSGCILAEIVGLLAACGFIIGSLSLTGVAHSFSSELIRIAGGNPLLILIVGAITSYILGMGMPISATYIFLSIVLVPSLMEMGFNIMAINLFVVYWGLVSYFTPPVAIGAYTAAKLANADPIKTGLVSLRLGSVLYIIPFFFVYSPSLLLQTPFIDTILPLITCILGIILLAGSLEGYIIGWGVLSISKRILFGISGLLLAIPNIRTDVIGVVLLIVIILIRISKHKITKRSIERFQCVIHKSKVH